MRRNKTEYEKIREDKRECEKKVLKVKERRKKLKVSNRTREIKRVWDKMS